jgi:hypothetical protein
MGDVPRIDATRDCAGIAARLGEPLPGTAPHVLGWVLIEHDGPWDAEAPWSLLDPVIADALEARCAHAGVRTLAVRRTARRQRGDPRVCHLVSSRPERPWIARLDLAETKDLLDVDLDGIAAGVMPAGAQPEDGPLFAVCAHGRRDACCAGAGQQIRRTLDAADPGPVRETTHLGGHRFAGNLLVLPDGILYGRVDDAAALTIADATRRGRIVTPLLRGRTSLPQAAQAAEWFVRRRTGHADLDAVSVGAVGQDDGRGLWRVDLRVGRQRLRVEVAHRPTGCQRMTLCGGPPTDPGRWTLVSVTGAGAGT